MDIEKFRGLIKEIGITNVSFSKHFHLRSELRGIKESNIIDRLKDCENLILIEEQGNEPKGNKYKLLFKYMSNYDLIIVLSIKDGKINVITAHIQNIKKRKAYKAWSGN
jgi:hypothetical protein